jgi:hypothetical protein
MGLYFRNKKVNIRVNNTLCKLRMPSSISLSTGPRLITPDGFILKDTNSLYLVTQGENKNVKDLN